MTRTFVRMQLLALLSVPLLASPGLTSHIVIAGPKEPGQRLVITGRVFGADGKPRGGVEIYAYHTGADGLYRPDRYTPEWPLKPPRLQGTLRTASDGSYQIETIKPGAYPSRNNPAHIHFKLRASGYPEQGETIWFEGDPLLTPQQKHAYVVHLQADSGGTLHGIHDFHLGTAQ